MARSSSFTKSKTLEMKNVDPKPISLGRLQRASSEVPESKADINTDSRLSRSASMSRTVLADEKKRATMVVRLHPGHMQTIAANKVRLKHTCK